MAKPLSTLLSNLSELGLTQGGFLTASQASATGVDQPALRRLTSQGFLEREQRGLYRLSHFPLDENAELWRAALWPMLDRSDGTPAALCYGTALSLYDVSTINPKRIDIAVRRDMRFRRSTPLPPLVQLHQKTYPPEDLTITRGLPSTTLFRTIADLIATNTALQFVDEALRDPRTQSLLTSREQEILAAMRVLDRRAISILQTEYGETADQ
jgi:predicted transcriptional regulator of viral defense system